MVFLIIIMQVLEAVANHLFLNCPFHKMLLLCAMLRCTFMYAQKYVCGWKIGLCNNATHLFIMIHQYVICCFGLPLNPVYKDLLNLL